jgi:hypothetical protein
MIVAVLLLIIVLAAIGSGNNQQSAAPAAAATPAAIIPAAVVGPVTIHGREAWVSVPAEWLYQCDGATGGRYHFTCIDVETTQGLGRAIVQVGDSDGVNTEIVAGDVHAGQWVQEHR